MMNLADHEPYKSLSKRLVKPAHKSSLGLSVFQKRQSSGAKKPSPESLSYKKANKGIARLKRKIERLTRETLEEK